MYEGWSFIKRAEWLVTGDGPNNGRENFVFGTCTTIAVGDSDNY